MISLSISHLGRMTCGRHRRPEDSRVFRLINCSTASSPFSTRMIVSAMSARRSTGGAPAKSGSDAWKVFTTTPSSRVMIWASKISSPWAAITPAIFEKMPGVRLSWVITVYSHDAQFLVEILLDQHIPCLQPSRSPPDGLRSASEASRADSARETGPVAIRSSRAPRPLGSVNSRATSRASCLRLFRTSHLIILLTDTVRSVRR